MFGFDKQYFLFFVLMYLVEEIYVEQGFGWIVIFDYCCFDIQ